MEFWLKFLPLVIYILLIALIMVGIVLGIKVIMTMNKVEKVVDNVNDKVQSLNSLFNLIDFTTDKIVGLTDKVVDGISNLVRKICFRKNNKRKELQNEEE